MKPTRTFIISLLALATILTAVSCASTPNRAEQYLFDITTNRVETVTATTNVTPGMSPVIVYSTNVHETYDMVPSERAEALTESGRRIGGLFGPWGEVIGLGLGGLWGLWGTLRSNKKGRAINTLVQSVETARQLISATPNGGKLDAQFVSWLKENQKSVGVINEVANVLDKVVDTNDAKKVAETIRAIVGAK